MKRILLDQGLSPGAAPLLREIGFDAIHVREIGKRDADDVDILAYASQSNRTLITLDHDFPQILALTSAARPSVVLIRRQGLRALELADLIVLAWKDHEAAIGNGCVLKVGARGFRVHALPLR